MPTPVPVADNGISDIESDVIITTPLAVLIVHILLGVMINVDGATAYPLIPVFLDVDKDAYTRVLNVR